MIQQLSNWQGKVQIDGVSYNSIADVPNAVIEGCTAILLIPKQKVQKIESNCEHIITVKKYMTMPSTPDFTLMKDWNNDIPMPLRTMVGTVEKETAKMVYMKLHGDIVAKRMCTCMKCGRQLTNPVSQFFGIGPECGGHSYVNPFETEAELKDAVKMYREKVLKNITWNGWLPKSSIIEDVIKEEAV